MDRQTNTTKEVSHEEESSDENNRRQEAVESHNWLHLEHDIKRLCLLHNSCYI